MFGLVVSCAKVSLLLAVAGWFIAGLFREPDRSWIRRHALWIMPAMYTAAMFSSSIWMIYACVFLVLPLAARKREDVAALLPFAFLGIPYMTQDVRVGGSALLTLTSWHCIFLGAWLAVLAKPATAPKLRIAGTAVIPFVLLFLITTITIVHGANATTAMRGLIELFLLYGIPFLVVTGCVRTRQDLRRLCVALLIAITLQAIVGFYQSRSYWPIYENIFWSTGIPMPKAFAFKVRAGMMRATASYLESNSLAMLCAMGFVLTLAVRSAFRSRKGFWIVMAITLVGIYATVSRGGFVFVALAWLGFEAYRGRWGRVGGAVVVLGALYGIAKVGARYVSGLEAFTGGSADSKGTAEYRQQLLQRGWEEIMRSPIVGYDWDTIQIVLRDLRQGEGIIDFVNGYILAGITGGVGAMVALFMLFVTAAAQLYRLRNRLPDDMTQGIAAGCFGVQTATVITCFTSGFFGNAVVPYAMLLGAGAVLPSLAVRRGAVRPAIEPKPAGGGLATA